MHDTRTQPDTEPENQIRAFRATVEAAIPRPPQDVYGYLSRLENNPDWNWSVTAITSLTLGPTRPGARYLQASAADPDHPQILELSRVEPPHLLEVKATGSASSVTYRYELRPADDGDTTQVTVQAEVCPRHPVGLSHLYIQRLRGSIRANLDTLRNVLARSQPGGGLASRRDDAEGRE